MSSKLSDKQKLRIQTRHRVSVERHGYQPQALFWSNKEIQEIRFENLMGILGKSLSDTTFDENWSLLDVGCGFADLKFYLAQHNFKPDYSGIDVSPNMVLGACSQHPGINVHEGELADFDYKAGQFDYVMLSGALNEVVETAIEGSEDQQGDYARSVIRRMYQICRAGVAFNLLNRSDESVGKRTELQSFYPAEMFEFCQSFAQKVILVEGYLDNDFTIYLYK